MRASSLYAFLSLRVFRIRANIMANVRSGHEMVYHRELLLPPTSASPSGNSDCQGSHREEDVKRPVLQQANSKIYGGWLALVSLTLLPRLYPTDPVVFTVWS